MLTAGLFVGGKARRMRGAAKGLFTHPSGTGTVLDHLIRQARAVGAEPVFIGDHPAYRAFGLEVIEDAVADIGPAGGLLALLRRAQDGIALALACDMPYVPASLLRELVAGVEGGAPAFVPRRADRLEPLCAAYRANAVLPHVEACLARGERGLFKIAREAGAVELALVGADAHFLDDWDSPEDVSHPI